MRTRSASRRWAPFVQRATVVWPVTAVLPIAIPPAFAGTLPAGASVVAGKATVTTPAPNTLVVRQTTPRAVVNWSSFDIGQGARVSFAQPGIGAATLNIVTADAPSRLAGALEAGGSVFIVNRNGIEITPTGRVDIGSAFVASSLAIDPNDFMDGALRFSGQGGAVVNRGRITAGAGGAVALLGGTVDNEGAIEAPIGRVGLGSAASATLDLGGDGFLQVLLPAGATAADGQALVTNGGTIEAAGGTVALRAATVREALREAINLPGTIRATSVSGHDGAIVLDGGAGGAVQVSGTLDASAAAGANDGGRVDVTGSTVALQGAAIAATGQARGGLVRIGGEFQGGKAFAAGDARAAQFAGRFGATPRLAAAQQTTVDGASTIDVSARGPQGTGGTAVVWSDRATTMQGAVLAGGASAGGAVEVSSAGALHAVALDRVHVGARGALLLDPADLTIGDDPSAGPTTDGVIAQLQAGTNVSLQANEDIAWLPTLAHPAIVTPPVGGAPVGELALSAGRSITLAGVFETGGGTWRMTANDTAADGIVSAERGAGSASIDLSQASFINTNGRLILSLQDGAGNAQRDADGIFLGSYGGEGLTASISPTATGPLPTRLLVTHSLSTAGDIVLTGNLQVSGQSGLTTLSAPHVDWTDETRGATIRGEGSFAFVENGVMTRYGTLTGADATRLALGDPAVTSASRVYGDADPGLAELGSPMLHLTAASTTPAADPLANLLQPGSIATTGPGARAGVGQYALAVGATNGFAFNAGLNGGYWIDLASTSVPLTVTARHLTPTVASAGTTYGTAETVVALANVVDGDAIAPVVTQDGLGGVVLQPQGGGFGLPARTPAGTTSYTLTGLAGAAASNYVLDLGGAISGTLAVAPRPLTWSIDANAGQTYGALPATPFAHVSGVLAGDDVSALPALSLAGAPVAYGARTPIGRYDASVAGLGGASASNYTFAATGNAPGTLTVSPKTLTWSVDSTATTYGDGGAAGAARFNGVLAGDDVAGVVEVLFNGTPFAPSARTHAGRYDEVVAGIGGDDAGNYVLAASGNTSGTYAVAPRPLTLASTGVTQAYGDVPGGIAMPVLLGVVDGDQVSATSQVAPAHLCACGFNGHDWTVGRYDVSLTGLAGANAADYALGSSGYSASVLPRTLAWRASSNSIVYGDRSVSVVFDNVVPGDDVVATSLTATDRQGASYGASNLPHVGTYDLSLSQANVTGLDGNYVVPLLSAASPTLVVSPKPLTWVVGNGTAVYGNALAGAASLQGLVDGAQLDVQLGAVDANGQAVARPGVGSWSVGVASISGDGSANYTLSATGSTDGRFIITPRPVTWRTGDAHSIYGDPLATAAAAFGNVLPGDDPGAVTQVVVNGTPVAPTARLNAGAYQSAVTTLTNPNYVLASSGNTSAEYDVWRRPVTFAVPDAASTYGTAATPGPGTVVGGVLPGDVVAAGPTVLRDTGGAPTDRTGAGTWLLDMQTLAGRDAGNYVPTDAGSTLGTLAVAPKPVTYTMQGSFQYNLPFTDRTATYGDVRASDLPQGVGTVNGVLAGDDVGIAAVNPASMPLSSSGLLQVGRYTFSGGALTGAAAGNYVLQPTGNVDATLQVQPMTVHIAPTLTTAAGGPVSGPYFYGSTDGLLAGGVMDQNVRVAASNDKVAVDPSALYVSLASGLAHGLPDRLDAGDYAIVANGSLLTGADAHNFNAVLDGGRLTVLPRPVSVTIGQASRPYGQVTVDHDILNLYPDTTINGLLPGDDLSVQYRTSVGSGYNGQGRVIVGSYDVFPTILSGASKSNYTLSRPDLSAAAGLPPTTSGTLVVTPAVVSFDPDQYAHQLTYGQTLSQVDVTGLLPGDDVAVVHSLASASNAAQPYAFGARLPAGEYAYTLSLAGRDAYDYQLRSPLVADYTVVPKPVTVSLSPMSRSYGSVDPAGDGVTVNGLEPGDTLWPTFTASAGGAPAAYDAHTEVGRYVVHATGLGASPGGAQSNYTFVDTPGGTSSLTITPRALSFLPLPSKAAGVYGDGALLGTLDGVVAGDDIGLQATLSGGAPAGRLQQDAGGGVWYTGRTDVGDYHWTSALTGARTRDYTLASPAGGDLAITPRPVVWGVDNAWAQHGGYQACDPTAGCTNPWVPGMPLGAAHLQNVLAGDDVAGSVIAVDGNGTPIAIDGHTPVGAYFEVVGGLTGASAHNYRIAPSGSVPGAFQVVPEWVSYSTTSGIYLSGNWVGTPGVATLRGPDGAFADADLTPTVTIVDRNTGAILSSQYSLPPGHRALFVVTGFTGKDAGDFRVLPDAFNDIGTLDRFTSTDFGLGLTGADGYPPAPALPKAAIEPPPADPLPPLANYYASQDADLDPEFGRNITRTGAGGGIIVGVGGTTVAGGASGVAGTDTDLGGGVDTSTQASGEASGLVKWGVTGVTVTATADAHADIELKFGPGYVEFGVQADSSANAQFSGSGATLKLDAQAGAYAQTGVSGDLGGGADGKADATVGLFAYAHSEEGAGYADDKLNGTVNERIGFGASAGGSGLISGSAGSVAAGATVYSLGVLGGQASAQAGFSGGSLTLSLDLGAELGIAGFEFKTGFSVDLSSVGQDVAHLFGFSTSGPQPVPLTSTQVLLADGAGDPVARYDYLNQNQAWMHPTAADLSDRTVAARYQAALDFYDNFGQLMQQTRSLMQQEQQMQAQMLALLKTDPAAAVQYAHGSMLTDMQVDEIQLVKAGRALGVALAVKDGQLTYVQDNTRQR